MFKEIDADCYLMIDGDDTYPAENAREMCNYVLEDNDPVKAWQEHDDYLHEKGIKNPTIRGGRL